MEKLTFDKVVGFVLAACFALVIGVSMWALLVGDYMNAVKTDQALDALDPLSAGSAGRADVTPHRQVRQWRTCSPRSPSSSGA